MKLSECRSCKAAVIWTDTTRGKRMPVDAEPASSGTFDLEDRGEKNPLAHFRPEGSEPGLRASHFATCPDAAKFRKGGPA